MKSRYLLVVVVSLMFGIAAAQTVPPKPVAKPAPAPTPASPSKPAPAAQPASTIAPDAPVITVSIPCDKKAGQKQQPATCTQTVTRAEFEKLVDAVSPQMNAMVRRNFAQNLARLLAYSAEAKRLGLDKTDQAREMLRFATMQVYAQELARKTQEQAANISDADIDAYYRDNQPKFEEFTLSRIVVPRRPPTKENPGNDDEEKAFAQKIRDRWAAGEDGEKLQKEAYKHAGRANPAPPVKLGERRRGSLSPSQDSVFNLKAGEISQPFNDPSASFIYKVENKQMQPLDQARDEIKRLLTSKRLETAIEELTKKSTTTFDPAYFETATAEPKNSAPAATKIQPAPTPAEKTEVKPPVTDKDPK